MSFNLDTFDPIKFINEGPTYIEKNFKPKSLEDVTALGKKIMSYDTLGGLFGSSWFKKTGGGLMNMAGATKQTAYQRYDLGVKNPGYNIGSFEEVLAKETAEFLDRIPQMATTNLHQIQRKGINKSSIKQRWEDSLKGVNNDILNYNNVADVPDIGKGDANGRIYTQADADRLKPMLEKRQADIDAKVSQFREAMQPVADQMGLKLPDPVQPVRTKFGFQLASELAANAATGNVAGGPAALQTLPNMVDMTPEEQRMAEEAGLIPATTSNYVYGPDVLNSKANNSAVNHLYQQYFGRDASQAELDNWGEKGGADTTVKALEDFLKAEQVKYNVTPTQVSVDTGEPVAPDTTTPTDDTPDPAEGLSDEAKELAESLSDAAADSNLPYVPDFSEENLDKWFQEGLDIADESFSEYEREVLGRARETYIQGLEIETQARELQVQQEELNRAQELKQAQSGLEASGATFSGEASELLGNQSALPPEMQTVVEGLLQKQQGILATSSAQRHRQALQARTRQAEDVLGTTAIQGILGSQEGLSSNLLQTTTPTSGSAKRGFQSDRLAKAQEFQQAKVAQELALSKDFPTADLTKYI